jgi:hypothetical protein
MLNLVLKCDVNYVFVIKFSQLMLFRHIVTIKSENHTKPTNMHGQNAEVFNVKAGDRKVAHIKLSVVITCIAYIIIISPTARW